MRCGLPALQVFVCHKAMACNPGLRDACSMQALSYLFVPADRPERFAKALAAGAHAVIVDLEDAVAPAQKTQARAALSHWLHSTDAQPVHLRINPPGTP